MKGQSLNARPPVRRAGVPGAHLPICAGVLKPKAVVRIVIGFGRTLLQPGQEGVNIPPVDVHVGRDLLEPGAQRVPLLRGNLIEVGARWAVVRKGFVKPHLGADRVNLGVQ